MIELCQEHIPYPSEDYPCMCKGFVGTDYDGECAECRHPHASHQPVRVCRPAGGATCYCAAPVNG